MKKLFSILLLVIFTNTLIAGTALASGDVMDVTTSSLLNIRSGPGLSYSIIAKINPGSDILFYYTGSDPGTSADGYNWHKMYYPSSSVGKYSSSAVGWAAWHEEIIGYTLYYDYTYSVIVTSSSGIYEYQYPNLTSPYPTFYPYGQSIGGKDQPDPLNYEIGYPNAWRVYRLDGTWGLGYADGWKVNAYDPN